MSVTFEFTNGIHFRVSVISRTEKIGRRNATATETTVGNTCRSSSRGTFGQRAGNQKDGTACAW